MKRWKINSINELDEIIGQNTYELLNYSEIYENYYSDTMEIPKKNGKRTICAVDKSNPLYAAQRNLRKHFLDNILLSDRAFGFVKEQSYFLYLQEHVETFSSRWYLRIDIKNFFGSIGESHIEKAFAFYVSGDEKEDIVDRLKALILFNGELVQGTPIAPAVSNIVFRPYDIRIERYCDRLGVRYSRYADDLLFSAESEGVLSKKFIRTIKRILESGDFLINYDKLRMSRDSLALNGFVVGKDVRLSRTKIKKISRIVFYLEKNPIVKTSSWYTDYNKYMSENGGKTIGSIDDLINILAGDRSFLLAAMKFGRTESYLQRCTKLITRIERQIVYASDI